MQGMRVATTVTPIHTVHPDMPLTTALSMLMEAGVSALPVVDQEGVLLDVYARSDITLLTRGSAYLHLAVRSPNACICTVSTPSIELLLTVDLLRPQQVSLPDATNMFKWPHFVCCYCII